MGGPHCLWHSRVRQPRTRSRILTPAPHPPKSHDASLATRCQPHRCGDQPPNPFSPLAPPLPTAAVIPKRGHFHSPAHIYRWSGRGWRLLFTLVVRGRQARARDDTDKACPQQSGEPPVFESGRTHPRPRNGARAACPSRCQLSSPRSLWHAAHVEGVSECRRCGE